MNTEPAFDIKIKLCITQQQFHIKTCGDIQNKMCALYWTSVMLQGLTNDNTTGGIMNNVCQLLHKFLNISPSLFHMFLFYLSNMM